MVAVRGLVRSLHSNFGFEPRNAMLVDTDLNMAGYRGDEVPDMQKRMLDAVRDNSRRRVRGIDRSAAVKWRAEAAPLSSPTRRRICGQRMPRLRHPCYNISPEYLQAARTTLAGGPGLLLA